MQTALHMHKNACKMLIVNTVENYLSSAHVDHHSFFFFFEFTPCKAKQPLQSMELQEKGTQKVKAYSKSL